MTGSVIGFSFCTCPATLKTRSRTRGRPLAFGVEGSLGLCPTSFFSVRFPVHWCIGEAVCLIGPPTKLDWGLSLFVMKGTFYRAREASPVPSNPAQGLDWLLFVGRNGKLLWGLCPLTHLCTWKVDSNHCGFQICYRYIVHPSFRSWISWVSDMLDTFCWTHSRFMNFFIIYILSTVHC